MERAGLPGGFGIDRSLKKRRRQAKRRRGVHEKFETRGIARRRNVIRYARKDVLISGTTDVASRRVASRRFNSTGAIARCSLTLPIVSEQLVSTRRSIRHSYPSLTILCIMYLLRNFLKINKQFKQQDIR